MSRPRLFITTSVRRVLQTSCNPNHTFNRTFKAATKLQETSISTPTQPLSIPQCEDELPPEIPHALQAEIYHLESSDKFRILLDSRAANNSIQLVCQWEDKHIPVIPPIYVTIPAAYPFKSPTCSLLNEDYLGTEFLRAVYKNLMVRIERLPSLYSLTRLLDAWETSVRQTFSPNHVSAVDLSEFFGV